ncbi:MAG: PspC domain-containing protein [Cruoricaptor ignavus]|nr:PspC domain-containing protein [Cruoricaptor ignavus]
MNKTLSIGLAGFSFIIEEHAYIKLSDYLAALRKSLDTAEADEVMHDIEIRMVEIFKDSLGKREVINDADVERVITQIGKPEEIEEQEEAYFSEQNTKQNIKTEKKQLFRDPERQKIAGVCAGLAHYIGMDVSAMRFIWLIIAILGVFTAAISTSLVVLFYIILWIVMPKAETASDFLKMKGKPLNFDNLKEESSKVVQFANESTQRVGELYNENKPYINRAGNGILNVFRYFFGAIFGLIGIVLLIGSFSIFAVTDSGNVQFFDNLGFYLQSNNLGYLVLALAFLTIFIPALIFSYLTMKLFSPKIKLKNTGYVIGGLVFVWLALSAFVGFSALKYKSQYSGQNDETENIALANIASDSILIDVKKVNVPQSFKSYWNNIYSDGKLIYKKDYPTLDVKKEAVKEPYLIVKKYADGYNIPVDLKVPVEVLGNKILLPNYISYSFDNRFRDYDVRYELVVPQNMKVIKLNERGYTVNNSDNDDDATEIDDVVRIEKNKITINGSTIEYNSDDEDSIIINDKKYPKKEADAIMDSVKQELKKIENLDFEITTGKNGVSIKTK